MPGTHQPFDNGEVDGLRMQRAYRSLRSRHHDRQTEKPDRAFAVQAGKRRLSIECADFGRSRKSKRPSSRNRSQTLLDHNRNRVSMSSSVSATENGFHLFQSFGVSSLHIRRVWLFTRRSTIVSGSPSIPTSNPPVRRCDMWQACKRISGTTQRSGNLIYDDKICRWQTEQIAFHKAGPASGGNT